MAATNISLVSGYEDWSCNSFGYPETDPCNATAPWRGVACNNGTEPVSLNLEGIGLTGKFLISFNWFYWCCSFQFPDAILLQELFLDNLDS